MLNFICDELIIDDYKNYSNKKFVEQTKEEIDFYYENQENEENDFYYENEEL